LPTVPEPIKCCFDGAVSSSHPIATQTGISILKKGKKKKKCKNNLKIIPLFIW